MSRIVRSDEVLPGACSCLSTPLGDVVAYSSRAPYRSGDEPNEDHFAVIDVDAENLVLVVADGVGGGPVGEVASRTIVDCLVSNFTQEHEPGTITATVIDAIQQAHQAIKSSGIGAASTVAIAHIDGATFRTAHAGDSVVMQFGGRGKLKFVTIAHSPVGYALEAGMLSEDEAFTHEERHIVSNIVGGEDLSIALGATLPIAQQDTLLLATDGLTDNLRHSEIIELARTGPLIKRGERLSQLGSERMNGKAATGKPDDMTFILFRRKAQQ